MHTISILLTKYSDLGSTLLYSITGFGYTHVSISLNDETGCYYSFNYRGFAVESEEKHRRKGVNRSARIQIEVSAEAYNYLQNEIHFFKENRESYRYCHLGVVLAVLKIPFEKKQCYFCSQFVAQLLVRSKSILLRKNANTYLPNHFLKELTNSKSHKETLYNVI